jgi:hypothetical protein
MPKPRNAGRPRGSTPEAGDNHSDVAPEHRPDRCANCGRSASLVETKIGPHCKKCADRLPRHLRRLTPHKSSNISRGAAKQSLGDNQAVGNRRTRGKRRGR